MGNTLSRIRRLVEHFHRNLEVYKRSYNETMVRREFIDPFFTALGWDVSNVAGYSEAYKDVIHEDAIKVGGATKAPDYAFRIGGVRKFFVEAKKPSVDIKQDIHPAYQLRRYAWSAKLPLSILTDFEEFAVYDCRIKPVKTDQAATARIMYLTFDQYPDRWEEIESIFSKEAILKGSFDRYVESTRRKRGTAEVDTAFLKEIEVWRERLARNIALRNPTLSQREVNFAVSRTIDRIIFLRICEDRGIEEYGQLMALQNGTNVYQRLVTRYRRADEKYNSGLFHFHPEKGRREAPDELTPKLTIDDKVLKDIFRELYYPDSPYEFSVLPADILGHIYEQFLGKVIRLTPGHRAKVEEKPEVRKAGGVYYTPTYIVDYIVKNTVGKLVEGKTPKQVARLKILDPACGSGSFLIGAYQYLLDWHRDWYSNHDPRKWARGKTPAVYQARKGDWRLTTARRKEILLNNIYGVDIDPQAVEVTKLSLLLKVLEGESNETINRQMKFFHERALPDLGNNIKCGNSLIGPDFYDQQQISLMDEEEQYRINAFDWEAEFPEVFGHREKAKNGFDAVIGNPPYVRIQAMKEWSPIEVEYYKVRYKVASKGNYDVYVVFIERGLSLLNKRSKLGFIVPNKFFNAQYGKTVRTLLAEGNYLSKIVHFGAEQVFAGATTYTCLLFLNKSGNKQFEVIKVDDINAWSIRKQAKKGTIPANSISSGVWNFVVGKDAALFDKLSALPMKLGNLADIFVGLQTSADDVFIMDFIEETRMTIKLRSKALNKEWTFEKDLLYPLVSGSDVNRYCTLPERQYILFPYKVYDQSINLIDFEIISKHYPKTASYFLKNNDRLIGREKGKAKGSRWYGYLYLKNLARQSIEKLCVPRLINKLYATYDAEGYHFLDNVDVGGITLKPEYQSLRLTYLLGLLNSKLLCWYFPFVSAPFRGRWLSANRQFLSQLPIYIIDSSNQKDKFYHDKIISLVNRMLSLHKQLSKAKTPHDREVLQRQIDATDRQIDQLVYELYGLTEEEIRIVEEQ